MAVTITGFSPAVVTGTLGETTTATGTGFLTGGTVTSVTVNGVAAQWSVTNDTTLVVIMPAITVAGLATVVVVSGSGTGTDTTHLTVTPHVFTPKTTRATFTGHFATQGQGVDVMDLTARYTALDVTTWAGADDVFLQKQAKIVAVNTFNKRYPDQAISPLPNFS